MMGLGILGRGVNVAKFLAECGAELTITDLKTEEQLAPSLKKLKKFTDIKYVLGRHDLADFSGKDMVIKAAGVPLDSLYIAEARKNNFLIEMDASLFAKLISTWTLNVQVVGITGTRGKSTVTHLIYEIIKEAFKKTNRKVYLGGNVKGLATLPLLKKVKTGDIVVMELDSWQLQGFGEVKISPNIAVFTTFCPTTRIIIKMIWTNILPTRPIFTDGKKNDWLIVGSRTAKIIKEKNKNGVKGQPVIANKKNFPTSWKVKLLGEHNLENIALAVEAVRKIGVKELAIKKTVENFKGLPGRLEFVREVNGVKYYNDTTATTPEAVEVALDSLPPHRRASKENRGKIILIGGGADKNLEYGKYAKVVKKCVKALILFRGLASSKIISALGKTKFPVEIADSMKKRWKLPEPTPKRRCCFIVSPARPVSGCLRTNLTGGGQFNKAVKKLK